MTGDEGLQALQPGQGTDQVCCNSKFPIGLQEEMVEAAIQTGEDQVEGSQHWLPKAV